MRVNGVNPPNRESYLNRCTALQDALKHKEVMPPLLIASMCQLLLVRAIGSPWRVVWWLILDRLYHHWDRLKSDCWWNWHMYVLLKTHDEIMEAWSVWLERTTGIDDREWPDEISIEEEIERHST